MRCKLCECYDPNRRLCQLEPPRFLAVVSGQGPIFGQPPTSPDNWCSHFRKGPRVELASPGDVKIIPT